MAGGLDLKAFEELKRQLEAFDLDKKTKEKFIFEEWKWMKEAEERRAEREAKERKLRAEAEAEERKLRAEAEIEERRL